MTSTLKTDVIESKTTDGDLTIQGAGTGVPSLETGFKVGGTAGVPVSALRAGTDGELITWAADASATTVAVGTATHVLTSNGTGVAPTFQAAGGGGGLQSVQTFAPTEFSTSALSATWTKPSGISTIRVQLIGGGASGNTSGKAGGAGGYSEKIIDVTSITSVTVTVGNRVEGHNNSGIATSFGTHCSATGGLATNPHTSNTSGGTGGVGTGGDINIQGGGGSSNHSDGGSAGAVGYFGGGSFGQATSNLGDHPAAYGSGGSGCNNGYASGSGARGLVIVWEYA